jgi:hypothetical protein
MPLHDWTNRGGWDGVHLLWITELLRWVKPQLPPEFRAYIGTAPTVAIGSPPRRPDVQVRQVMDDASTASDSAVTTPNGAMEPDEEVAVATLDPTAAVYVERDGRLVAAIELISPRNKDRPVARDTWVSRYAGYLLEGVHLLLVDLHPQPQGFSFADRIARSLGMTQPEPLPPMAVAYRVGEPVPEGGRLLGIWRRPLTVGEPLPTLPLPLDVDRDVSVDLETTYAHAAADAYIE